MKINTICKDCSKNLQICTCMNDTIDMKQEHGQKVGHYVQAETMYSEADMREAYFTAIRSTGEGWNGEYANGNCPNIEKTFNDGFEIFIEQYKKK